MSDLYPPLTSAPVEIFDVIAAERRAHADLLDSLTDEQLDTPSLCGQWSVREVGAHLLVAITTSLPTFLKAMLASRGSFDRANDKMARDMAKRPMPDITAELRSRAASRFTPPTLGPEAPLTDQLIHGQDIRRPLGIEREFDAEPLRHVLTFLATKQAERGFVARGSLAGLRFEVPELDWTGGEGAPVVGTGEAVLLAMSGRRVALDELSGDGVARLRAR